MESKLNKNIADKYIHFVMNLLLDPKLRHLYVSHEIHTNVISLKLFCSDCGNDNGEYIVEFLGNTFGTLGCRKCDRDMHGLIHVDELNSPANPLDQIISMQKELADQRAHIESLSDRVKELNKNMEILVANLDFLTALSEEMMSGNNIIKKD